MCLCVTSIPHPSPIYCWVIAWHKPCDCLVAIHKQRDLSLCLVLIKPQREEKYLPLPDLLDWISRAEYNLVQYSMCSLSPSHTPKGPNHKTHCIHTYTDGQCLSGSLCFKTYMTFFCVLKENMSFYHTRCHLLSPSSEISWTSASMPNRCNIYTLQGYPAKLHSFIYKLFGYTR